MKEQINKNIPLTKKFMKDFLSMSETERTDFINKVGVEQFENYCSFITENIDLINKISDENQVYKVIEFNLSDGVNALMQEKFINRMYKLGYDLISVACRNSFECIYYFKLRSKFNKKR